MCIHQSERLLTMNFFSSYFYTLSIVLLSLQTLCSRYASCLEYLGNLKANLMLDIHLHDHVETLYNQIRHKALIQYTLPFVSVDLQMMANAFKTSVAGLEKELEALITENQIQVCFHSYASIPLSCDDLRLRSA